LLRDDQVYTQLRYDQLEDLGPYRRFKNEELMAVKPVELSHLAQGYLLHEFYEAVTQGKTPATTCQDNIKSLAVGFDTVKSFEQGGPVTTQL
jgi:hypothetical protein